eukprot:NODE_4946_length_719_cov_38.358108_g4783_i0.p1 GENE.NODE_4946_length_719_cov_38.358108_g4783_i0~~NODE_4946_length_719_cov_38.358108_g4783_i0.p1  ORF type:complete len:195 (-),score=39.84 NODE_4946_length_719_cov_38.358108_g4783_i0:92-676(-)
MGPRTPHQRKKSKSRNKPKKSKGKTNRISILKPLVSEEQVHVKFSKTNAQKKIEKEQRQRRQRSRRARCVAKREHTNDRIEKIASDIYRRKLRGQQQVAAGKRKKALRRAQGLPEEKDMKVYNFGGGSISDQPIPVLAHDQVRRNLRKFDSQVTGADVMTDCFNHLFTRNLLPPARNLLKPDRPQYRTFLEREY